MSNCIFPLYLRDREAYEKKVSRFPVGIQRSLARKFDAIASPDGKGFPYVRDVRKADAFIESLPDAASDYTDDGLRGLVSHIISTRRLCWGSEELYTNRERDFAYVLRQERRRYRRDRETEMIRFGVVNKYSSWRAERDSKQQDVRCFNIMKKRFVVASDDRLIPLNDIIKKSREFHTWETLHRLSALAPLMTQNGWQAAFFVQTLPSRFHSKTTVKNGDKKFLVPNKKWDGTMPDDAHAWANNKHQNLRATLSQLGYEEGIDFMAVRTVEPHKDGTPHYNYVVIGDINFLDEFNRILHDKFRWSDDADGNESGAHRRIKVTFAHGEEACRKIVSYAAKYALKTYLPEDMHKTKEHKESHSRCKAWRQTWGIRAFSFMGYAPVTLWRECRSSRHAGADIDIVRYAQETNWVEFQNEFINIGKKNIKPIHEMRINKYNEKVKECIGHFIKETNIIIAERISRAQIVKVTSNITLIGSQPREAQPDITDNPKHKKWHPPPSPVAA